MDEGNLQTHLCRCLCLLSLGGIVLVGVVPPTGAQLIITYPSETEFTGPALQCPLNGHWYALGRFSRDWEAGRAWAAGAPARRRPMDYRRTLGVHQLGRARAG
ncbi:hypothetical protein HS125_09755 [bacterium]|nr:hypothetical protein [bacterium]